MKKSSLKVLSLIFSCVVLISCTNFAENDSSNTDYNSLEKVTLTGKIGINGAVPSSLANAQGSSASRTAIPDIPTDSKYFFIKAKDMDLASAAFENGTVEDGTYYIGLTIGSRFTITAGVSSDEEHSDVLLSTSWDTEILTRKNASTFMKDICLTPETTGTGTVSLPIAVASSITQVVCKNSSFAIAGSSQNYTLTQSGSDITCGSYDVTLFFYYDSEKTKLAYYDTQTINVFPNLETNKWVTGGGTLDPIDSTGKYEITSTLIEKFARTQIYVGNTNTGTASDITGTGSPYSPFETLSRALELIETTGTSTSDFNIWINGEVTGCTEIKASIKTTTNANTITIQGFNGNDRDILNGDSKGTVLTINTTVPITIKNLKITGGSAEKGGGIYNSGTLSLSDGCLVAGNTASNFGGGVYSTGTMFMYGSAVIGDSTKTTAATDTTETGCSNKAGYGAGIYSLGNLYLGYSESNTKTALTGGVFYNFSHDTGGIYQYANKTFLMNSGFVSYNAGRGIYVGNCSFTMSGGSVSGNTTFEPDDNNYQTNGAGIYAGLDSTVLISGGTISGNMAGEDGGGLYIAKSDTSVTIEGGSISSNTAVGNGKGIALTLGSLKMQGGVKVDSSNDVYLASGKVITVTGSLTGTTPVATITPAAWTRGTTIIQADGTNLTTLKEDGEYDYTNYFAISDEDWVTKLSSDKDKLLLDAPIYVAGTGRSVCTDDGDDTDGNGTKSKPFATIAKACDELTNSGADYTIYIDGTLTGVQSISDSSILANSLTIQGTSSSATINGNNAGPALQLGAAIPNLSILRLTITGGKTDSQGGGIFTAQFTGESKRIITLGDGTEGNGVTVTGNTAVYGGGIYINTGYEVTVTEGCKINENTAGNNNQEGSGGGIYNGGTLTMTGGQINNNKANSSDSSAGEGGGIYNNYGTIYLSGGEISSNEAGLNGGGINNLGTLTMTAGTIEKNSARFGAGVLCADVGTFSMESGSIRENTASIYGGALYNAGTFNIKGSAYIPSGVTNGSGTVESGAGKNDVYLLADTYITVAGTLTGTSPVATITPSTYQDTVHVLDLSTTPSPATTLLAEYKKFKVTPGSDGNYWIINSTGYLANGFYAAEAVEAIASMSGENTIKIFGSSLEGLTTAISDRYNSDNTLRLNIDLSDLEVTSFKLSPSYGIKTITLPDTLTSFDYESVAHDAGADIESFFISESNAYFSTQDGVVFNKDKTKLVLYPQNKTDTTYTIPSTVTTLEYASFLRSKVENLNGLSQIKHIGSGDVFYYAAKLKEADLSGLEDTAIAMYTFEGASSLTKVVISARVTSFSYNIFAYCGNLTEVHFKGTTPPTLENANDRPEFYGCSSALKFYVPNGSKSAYTSSSNFTSSTYNAYAGSNLSSIIIEE